MNGKQLKREREVLLRASYCVRESGGTDIELLVASGGIFTLLYTRLHAN